MEEQTKIFEIKHIRNKDEKKNVLLGQDYHNASSIMFQDSRFNGIIYQRKSIQHKHGIRYLHLCQPPLSKQPEKMPGNGVAGIMSRILTLRIDSVSQTHHFHQTVRRIQSHQTPAGMIKHENGLS